MRNFYAVLVISLSLDVNSFNAVKLQGKCLDSGAYYADGSKIGEINQSEEFTSEISNTTRVIGVKCCGLNSSSSADDRGMVFSINGSYSTHTRWKCLSLPDGVQEPEDWTQSSFEDRGWATAQEIQQDALADNLDAKLDKLIWFSSTALLCPKGTRCDPSCFLCRFDIAQNLHSNLTEGIVRYPGSDSPLEDAVYLASYDFTVDVMGCESATLTLKPCNRDFGNLVEVFFSAENNTGSKIRLCQNFPNNMTKCVTVATSSNATISCFYYKSFYVAFPPDGNLSVSVGVRGKVPLMNFSGWQTDNCGHITSVVMSRRYPLAKFTFYRSNDENRCLVTKEEVAQLQQCGDDYVDEQFCLSCGCCWQAFVSEFSADAPPNTRCFLSFANSTQPAAEFCHRSLEEVIGHIIFTTNGTTAFTQDPVAFVVGVKNVFNGIKVNVQFGDGSTADDLTLSRMVVSPVWVGNDTDDYYKATFFHRYDVIGEIMAVVEIVDFRKGANNTESVLASVNFTVEVPDLVILSSKPKVDIYEEVGLVLLTQNSSSKTTADVILDDSETRYNLTFTSELALLSWVPSVYRKFHKSIILTHFFRSAGKKEVTARKVIDKQSSVVINSRLVANTLITVRSLNETFARASFLTLSEQPVVEKELVQYALSIHKIINTTIFLVDFGDNTSTMEFMMDELPVVPDGVVLVQNASGYTFLFQHAFTSPGIKQPVIRISMENQTNEVFEKRTSTEVMQTVNDASLFADINITDLYEDVAFVLSAGNVVKHRTRVLIDFGDGNKNFNISLRRDVPLPLWFQKMQKTSSMQTRHWAVFTHEFSSAGLQIVMANITDSLRRDFEAVTATADVSIRSLEDTLRELLESLIVEINRTDSAETRVLFRMKSKKVLKDTIISIDYRDQSKVADLDFKTAKDIPDVLNFSHVYIHPATYEVEVRITSKDHLVQVNKTKIIEIVTCKPEESISLLGRVVIITETDDPVVEGELVTFLVLTERFLENVHLMVSDGKAVVNVSMKLEKCSNLPSSAKKLSPYFQDTVKHTFCDHGNLWLRFTLFSCKNASFENITKYVYTTVFSFRDYIGNPFVLPVEPARALARENVTFLVALENVNSAAMIELSFGDQHDIVLPLSAHQARYLRWTAEQDFSAKFKTVVNHSYASEGYYEVTVQVRSRNSGCVKEAAESKILVTVASLLPDAVDMSIESQSYQSIPVNEVITFDVYTRNGISNYVAELAFGLGSETSIVKDTAPEITQVQSYRKQSYKHKFLNPGLYTVTANVADQEPNRSAKAKAKRSRCVNVIAFDEAVGRVRIFAVDEGSKKFLVGQVIRFVILVKNSIHDMHVSVSYGDGSSPRDTVTFQDWENNLPFWALVYQQEQYHYGITNHVFTNAGTFFVTVNVTKDDLVYNVTFAVVESLWITVHPKSSLSIIIEGGGADISSAVKYNRQELILLSASIHDYNDGDVNISWTAHRLESTTTTTQDTNVVFISPDVDTTKTSLSIPPFSLNFGTYIFHIQLILVESRGLLKTVGGNHTWITVIALPLQSLINMKKHHDGLISWVELDGSGSSDPNEDRNSHMTFEWHCSQRENSYLPETGQSLCNGSSRCVHSCLNLPSGNYQSCFGCNFYATCYNDTLYDSRSCPAKSFWDDTKKRCSTNSATCTCEESVTTRLKPGCLTEAILRMTGPVIKLTARDFKFSHSQVNYFFELVVVSRLGVLGKSNAVKVSVVSQHFHDSLPPPPSLSIICISNCKHQLQPDYPLILTFQCLHCQLSDDETLSSSWKVTGNFTMAKAESSWKRDIIYHQEHFIIKPVALSKITPGNEYLVTLKVTGPGRSISATYKFSVGQNATLEYQQLDKL